MKIPFVDLKTQYFSIKPEIDRAIQNVLLETAFIKGKYVEEFENNFSKKLEVKHCIGVGNGTDAIFIALKDPLKLSGAIKMFFIVFIHF